MDLIQFLEDVLNCELQDPLFVRMSDYSEIPVVAPKFYFVIAIQGPEAIGQVERFGSELQSAAPR